MALKYGISFILAGKGHSLLANASGGFVGGYKSLYD
jgi:hypothetical protein